MKYLTPYTVVLVIVVVLGILVGTLLAKSLNKYQRDTLCIQALVSKGIDRKDISNSRGICTIYKDAYYTSM